MSELDKLTQQAPSTLDRFRLENKKAIMVGGNQGLGQAMAMALAAAGADVCIVARGPKGLKETADAIFRLTSLPLFDQRFVIPAAHREEAMEMLESTADVKGNSGFGFKEPPKRGL